MTQLSTTSEYGVLGVRDMPASRLWGPPADELAASLTGDVRALVDRVEGFLRTRWPEPDPNVALVGRIVSALLRDRSTSRVDDVVERFGIAPRTLQRLFARYVGVSPKWVLRRYRLHEAAARLAQEQDRPWAEVAAELGYFDQSHFIRDFTAAIGLTPVDCAQACRTQQEPISARSWVSHRYPARLRRMTDVQLDRERAYTWDDPRGVTAAAGLDGLTLLRGVADGSLPAPPIAQTVGFDLESVENGRAVFVLKPAEYHYNPIGSVHGGVYATLLDSACGCAVHSTLPAGVRYTSLDLNVKFLGRMTADTGLVRCEGWVVHAGRSTVLARAELRNEAGKLLGEATSSCLLLR